MQEFSSGIGRSPRPRVETSPVQEQIAGPTNSSGSHLDIPALNALALRSLVSLFEEREKLFSRRVTLTEDGFRRERTSRKRTIIALLGLHRLAESGEAPPVDVASIRDAILQDTSWVRSVGDLGLLTWFTAECAPERIEVLLNELDFGQSLVRYADGRNANTRGLA